MNTLLDNNPDLFKVYEFNNKIRLGKTIDSGYVIGNLDIDYDISLLFDNENNIKTECSYIYLIEKYDVNEKQTIFKFGKTNRNRAN